MSGGNIKVVARCRPLNARARGAKGLIQMEDEQTILGPPELVGGSSSRAAEKRVMTFSFDKSYWSAGARDEPNYASQQTLYNDLGVELLDHSFEGFNTCIFAYGQTGSGKSYSMMGYGSDKGIIPLTTSELFRRVESRSSTESNLSYTVEVSYIEIYNEKVRDLLNPKTKGNLRVREHPSLGPYVEDLSRLVVEDYQQMMTLMDEGNKARTVASTNMNETSSRSHAVFTVILTQKRHDASTNMAGEKVSKISLVDLAGSERQASTGATGTRLKEGANINKSLTTLGKVIAALAQASSEKSGKKRKDDFVPYRDSVLTWLLKESLGGNSKTAMIAAISPADYEETLSTLRYADAAKRIKTHAVVNEDPNAKLIRELKEELEMLRSRVSTNNAEDAYDPSVPPEQQIVTFCTKDGEIRKVTKLELQDQLQASEKLMEGLNQTWEEKMATTEAIQIEREKALEELGIMVDKDLVGVHAPQNHPSLVNLNEDPLMSECLVYQIKPGTTLAGSTDGVTAHIKLSGPHILAEHCIFTNESGIVSLEAMEDARTFVNGKRVPPKASVKLLNGYRVILGDLHVFRFNDPAAVRAQRQRMFGSVSMGDLAGVEGGASRPDSPGAREGEMMDWVAARREVADIEKLGDHDLDRLFDDIVKVRTQRKRPESRYDSPAEFESRVMSTSQTEESFNNAVNPWTHAQETTMTDISVNTPVQLDIDRSERPAATELDTPPVILNKIAGDAVLEQQHLTIQLRAMAQEMKRIRAQAAVARVMEGAIPLEPVSWSAKEVRLAKWVVGRWKARRAFAMAEQILKMAVDVREANVIANVMGKSVTYNFLVVGQSTSAPVSALDGASGVTEFEDVSTVRSDQAGPSVVIKVMDTAAKAVYTWDLARFKQQLAKMQHVLALKEKPNYSVHFRVDEPFIDRPPPSFSFVGATRLPLRLLASQISHTSTLPILCQYTMEALGSCRVDLKCTASGSPGIATPEPTSRPLLNPVEVGAKLSFAITVDTTKGLSSVDFEVIHAQIRLSSLVGETVISEDTFTSQAVHLDRNSVAHLLLRQAITITVTPAIEQHLCSGYASIEFFAKVRPEYQSRLARFDRSREVSVSSLSAPSTPQRSGETRPAMRRNETDFVGTERHDILANTEVLEMSSSGDYVPSDVYDEVFQLHQGLQRRLRITLTHSSGKALPWSRMAHVSTAHVRVVEKGREEVVSKSGVEMKVVKLEVEDAPDGSSKILAEAVWDTSSHHCIHLDRRTPAAQTILVRLTFLIEIETLDEPAALQLDMPIRIVSRVARRSSLLNIFSSVKVYHSMTSIFTLDLVPPLARSARDLWRLDTGRKHVRGEEGLKDWKPRGLSLLDDFERLKRTWRCAADVGVTRAVLELVGEADEAELTGDERLVLLEKCVGLWKGEVDCRFKIDIARRSVQEEAVTKRLRKLVPEMEPKMVPTVRPRAKTENVTKSGALMLLRNSTTNEWEKLYLVLRRPYLHVHASPNEREIQVINLEKAHVIASPDVEMLLGKRFAFTIFTTTNSYILQAPSAKELGDWLSVITTSAGI